jgi:hypothetical protein
MSDLVLAEADLARTPTRISDGENPDEMPFTTVAFGTARTVTNDSLKQRAAENISGVGKRHGKAIAFAGSSVMFHY